VNPYLLLAISATVGATGYFSALNLAMVQASRSGLEDELEGRRKLAEGRWVLDRLHEASHAVALFRTVGRVAVFALVLVAFEGFGDASRITWQGLTGTALVSIALVWFFTSVVASAVARHATYAMIASSLPFIRLSLVMVGPLLAAVGFVDEVVRRLTGANLREDEKEEELLNSIEDSRREGEIDPVAATLLQRAVVFGQTTVASVMTPRTRVEAIELTDDLSVVRAQIAASGHSRMPVYEDSLDSIVGILYVRDLVRFLGDDASDFQMRAMLREPLRVPETKPIGELLRDFQRSEVHMAVVVDEYGGTSGLCTIEDVIEEIVGEIHDEHEPEHELPPEMVAVGERRYEADGRVTIAEINERLELALPEDGDFDTVAGFLLDRFGRVPVAGERDEIPEAIFEVIAASATRIERVAIEVRSGRMPASDASLEELEAMRDGKLDLDVERESSHDPQSEARQEARQEVRQEPRHE